MLSAFHLVRSFGARTAVDDVTFEVKAGEVFGLLDPNGAGKTTTLRMLGGLIPPTSGEVRIKGVAIDRPNGPPRRSGSWGSRGRPCARAGRRVGTRSVRRSAASRGCLPAVDLVASGKRGAGATCRIMNVPRIRTLVAKELREFRSNPAAVLPVIVLVVMCVALPFFVLIVIPHVTGESLAADRTIRGIVALAARTQPHLARLPPGTAAEAFLFQQFLLLFLVACSSSCRWSSCSSARSPARSSSPRRYCS